MVDTFGNIGFRELETRVKLYSVQVKAINSKGATNERAVIVIIMLATKQN